MSVAVNLVLPARRPLQQPAAFCWQALRRDAGRAHRRPCGPHSRLPGCAQGVVTDSSAARAHRTASVRTSSSIHRCHVTLLTGAYSLRVPDMQGAVTIAVRYGAQRQQFGPPEAEEIAVLDYQSLQW